jgi:hypothetical protein
MHARPAFLSENGRDHQRRRGLIRESSSAPVGRSTIVVPHVYYKNIYVTCLIRHLAGIPSLSFLSSCSEAGAALLLLTSRGRRTEKIMTGPQLSTACRLPRMLDGKPVDPEVLKRARRRTFTTKYKLEDLAAYEAAASGEKVTILGRDCRSSSRHIAEWRARDAGALAALAQLRGRKQPDSRGAEIVRLRKEKQRLSRSWPRPAS